MNKHVKIAFFGSDEIALPCLQAMSTCFGSIKISAVLTQPDRRSGRGRTLQSNPIKKWAIESAVPFRDPQKPGIEEVTCGPYFGNGLWSHSEASTPRRSPIRMF
jgi:methionyl-tRNA formyltransferase